MPKLKYLEVRNVRGIGPYGPDLPLNGASVMILGENGTGKSSYVDAVEYVLTRQSSSLDIGKRGLSWKAGGPHIHSSKDPTITLTVSDDQGSESQIGLSTDPASLPQSVQNWLSQAEVGGFLLRRRSMLQFLESDPKDRYDSISTFLALDKFEQLESQLKDLVQEWAERVKGAESDAAHHASQLRTNLTITGTVDTAAALNAYNQLLIKEGRGTAQTVEEVRNIQTSFTVELQSFSGVEQAAKYESILSALSETPSSTVTLQVFDNLITGAEEHLTLQENITKGFSASVLRDGLAWIDEGNLEECPLCEHPFENKEAVRVRIQERLASNDDYIRSTKSVEKQRLAVALALSQLMKTLEAVSKAWAKATTEALPDSLAAVLDQLRQISERYSVVPAVTMIRNDKTIVQQLDIEGVVALAAREVRTHAEKLPGVKAYQTIASLNRLALLVLTHAEALETARKKYAIAQGHHKQADLVLKMAVQARKEAVQQAVSEVAAEANRLYSLIHPGESIGKAKLTVPQRGQGSLDLDASFHERQEDPRLLYSESHLDTLGLCFFLAIRRLNAERNPNFRLLVLDDVLHSVDSAHRQQTAEMLLSEFADHQMVITTHDPIWFQRFKEVANRKSVKFLFKRIGGWTIESGPQWGDHESDYEYLKAHINAASANELSVRAGRLMEEVLQIMCEQLQISVPFRRNGRYELGTLWPPFFKAAGKQEGYFAQASTVCNTINGSYWVRNEAGAHFNESAAPVSPAEAKAFAQAALDLTDQLKCSVCGKFVQWVPAPKDDWTCQCGTLSYKKKGASTAAG